MIVYGEEYGTRRTDMKASMKTAAIVACFLFLLGALAWAQMGPGMMGPGYETEGESERGEEEKYEHGPYYGYGCGMMGYGMGPGMMGYGYGPGMMGGYGMGYGMGPGMMGGYGMGYGMGPGMMYPSSPEMRKFLDETREKRKEIHLKMFDYMEALRNPDTSYETIRKLQKEMGELSTELLKKAPRRPWGRW
jgi:hypothetical protein